MLKPSGGFFKKMFNPINVAKSATKAAGKVGGAVTRAVTGGGPTSTDKKKPKVAAQPKPGGVFKSKGNAGTMGGQSKMG